MTFSNISSEMSPEETGSEAQEIAESPEVQEEAAQLEQATFEPEAAVELDNSHQDAEVVETAFTETMQTVETSNAKDAELIPENDNAPGEEVMIDTVPLPEKPADRVAIIDSNDGPRTKDDPQAGAGSAALGGFKDGEMPQGDRAPAAIIDSNDGPRRAVDNNLHAASEEISATPITLPGQEREGGQDGRPGSGMEATPINLPNPQDEVSATPIPLPDPQDEISATPITLPGQGKEGGDLAAIIDTNDGPRALDGRVMIDTVPLPEKPADRAVIIDSNDIPRDAGGKVSATPIEIPGKGKVSATPIEIPGERGSVSVLPIPIPGQGKENLALPNEDTKLNALRSPEEASLDSKGVIPGGGVEATPINLPNSQEEISATPITLPGQGKEASLDGKGDDRVAIGTWPTPDEEMEIAQKAAPSVLDARKGDERVKIDTVPLPEEPAMKAVSLDGKGADVAAVLDDDTMGQFFDPDRVSEGGRRDGMPGDGMLDVQGQDVGNMTGGDPRDRLEIPGGNDDGLPFDKPPGDGFTDGQNDTGVNIGEDDQQGEGLFGKGGIPGVKDPLSGKGSGDDMLPGDLGGPATGPDQESEMAGLRDAAAPGGDSRAGIGLVKYVTGKIWGAITKDSGTDKGGGGGGVRGTPDPEGGEAGEMPELVIGNKVVGATPGARPVVNHADSMMQPVDDEGQGREQPGMKMSAEELRDAQLNPYIQNTDDHVDVLPGSRGDMTDPKDFLIDNDLEPFAPGSGGGSTNPLAKPSTNDDAPPPPPPGGGKPGVSMDQMSDMVSSKPPDGGDGKPPDGADQVFKPSTNDDAPPPPPPGGGKPGVSMDQMSDMVSSKPPDGGDGKPPDGADLNLLNGLENSLSPDTAPADLSSMMDEGTMLNANENKDLKDLDETNTQNLAPTDGKL